MIHVNSTGMDAQNWGDYLASAVVREPRPSTQDFRIFVRQCAEAGYKPYTEALTAAGITEGVFDWPTAETLRVVRAFLKGAGE